MSLIDLETYRLRKQTLEYPNLKAIYVHNLFQSLNAFRKGEISEVDLFENITNGVEGISLWRSSVRDFETPTSGYGALIGINKSTPDREIIIRKSLYGRTVDAHIVLSDKGKIEVGSFVAKSGGITHGPVPVLTVKEIGEWYIKAFKGAVRPVGGLLPYRPINPNIG